MHPSPNPFKLHSDDIINRSVETVEDQTIDIKLNSSKQFKIRGYQQKHWKATKFLT